MKMGNIRSRLLLAAVLPVTLVALLLASAFLGVRIGDIDEAYDQRGRSLARQLAAASEYGVFSGNVEHLQTLVNGAMRESDVHSVAILDNRGRRLVHAGKPGYDELPGLGQQEGVRHDSVQQLDLLSQPIMVVPTKLDDLLNAGPSIAGKAASPMGHVLIEFSRGSLLQREYEMLLAGLGIAICGMVFGGVLALRLGRGVIRPIARVSNLIDRLGRGELSARATLMPNDPLRDLQKSLNRMAERLELGRDEMQQRIDQATLEYREKREEAETATQAKSRFLAAASHDLRQPTHALGMFVARLAQLPHEADTRHLIGNLDAAVQALQDLLDGLLDVSRLDAQSVSVQLRPFALGNIFEQLRVTLRPVALSKGLRLRFRPTDVWLMSDPTLVHRILLNLVANALRYTRAGGVLVGGRLSGDGRHVRVEVWDSGIGIAPEHHRAIFKEFYQVGNVERDRGKGLGLGLNIVERTAHLLGHPLHLCSRPGHGTRFSLEVPRLLDDAAREGPSPVRASPLDDLAGLVVLVIEDDALAREALGSLLASWDVAPVVAEGLSAALWQIKNGPLPDVIVSDYRLREGETGIEVIRQLRMVAGRLIPACLMSGDTDAGLMQEARSADLTLLHKPVRPAKLRSLIRRLAVGAQGEDPVLA